MTYRAVFFDAGETLVHPHPTFPELFVQVLAREGFAVTPQAVRAADLLIADRFRTAAASNDLWTTSPERSRTFWHAVYDDFLGRLGVPSGNGLHDTLYREFTDLANYALFDDVLPTLRVLAETDLRLGVISNFEEWLALLLDELKIAPYFEIQVISGVEGIEKPDPAIFRLALDRTGVDPAEAAYVGDNPHFDTVPASDLGMLPVLIDRRVRFPDEPHRIDSLTELPPLLGVG
ncbi:MAG: HAD-IA family hydrolase [Actinomycetota bacterium]